MTQVYKAIAQTLAARIRCDGGFSPDWFEKHTEKIEHLIERFLPSGSGFDAGVTLNFEKSTPNKLVFDTAFRHINENGYYDGWTEHRIVCSASLAWGFDLTVTGKDRNAIKDLITEAFQFALSREFEEVQA